MAGDEEYYDGHLTDQEPTFRSHTDITPDELTSALHSLVLLRSDMYFGLQVTNLTAVDQFIMNLEHQTLQEYIQADKTPSTTMFLNAQSQMWIFAAYELLRSWRTRAKDIIKLAKNDGLELKAANLEENQGYLHAGREMRAKQLQQIAADPSIIETIKVAFQLTRISKASMGSCGNDPLLLWRWPHLSDPLSDKRLIKQGHLPRLWFRSAPDGTGGALTDQQG